MSLLNALTCSSRGAGFDLGVARGVPVRSTARSAAVRRRRSVAVRIGRRRGRIRGRRIFRFGFFGSGILILPILICAVTPMAKMPASKLIRGFWAKPLLSEATLLKSFYSFQTSDT